LLFGSCYFQSKSCGNTVAFNVCFNGPVRGGSALPVDVVHLHAPL
jgi:hypothetical protein